jgi:hypothetical protein
VVDFADDACVDELLGVGDGGRFAVVEEDAVLDAVLFDGFDHRARFGEGVREGFLAQHDFAMLGSLDRDGRVQVAWRGHIDEVDVLAGDDLLPVGGVLSKPYLWAASRTRASLRPQMTFSTGSISSSGKKRLTWR